MTVTIPTRLEAACTGHPDRAAWLARLPDVVRTLEERWSLTLEPPFDGDEVSCAWVARAQIADRTRAVLKIGMPHMEAAHEIDGLRFWDGDGTVRLLGADDSSSALLLECCEPGTALRMRPEVEQDVVIAGLLRRLWRPPMPSHPFRPLTTLVRYWSDETRSQEGRWVDPALVRDGLRLFEELATNATANVLLATDLHAGNVLAAQREPWLVIDPKPFTGDPAFDATQHILNCRARLRSDPRGTIGRFSGLLDVDAERVRGWLFSRLAAEPRDNWTDEQSLALARSLAF